MPVLLAREPKPFKPFIPDTPLFDAGYGEKIKRTERIRPLSVSNFVVEKMPLLMLKIQQEIPGAKEELIEQATSEIDKFSKHHHPARMWGDKVLRSSNPHVAFTDLLFLQTAMHMVDPKAELEGTQKIKKIVLDESKRLGRVPTITYADIVNPKHNPVGDRRTFYPIDSFLGQQEWQFAQTHTEIEQSLSLMHHAMYEAIQVLNRKGKHGVERAVKILQRVGFRDTFTLLNRYNEVHSMEDLDKKYSSKNCCGCVNS